MCCGLGIDHFKGMKNCKLYIIAIVDRTIKAFKILLQKFF